MFETKTGIKDKQNDVHEFLIWLLDSLNEEAHKININSINSINNNNNNNNNNFKTSLITDLFQIWLKHENVQGNKCKQYLLYLY